MNEVVELIVRVLSSIAVLLVLARLEGAKQISQLTFFDYIVGITVGSIAGALCIEQDIPIYAGILAIVLYMLASMLVSFITNKSIFLRRILTGVPIFLIMQGEIMYKGMKRARFDINDLLRELRSQGYFDITEINYAILESNGQISVMPKAYARPVTNKDMNVQVEEDEVLAHVILDGKILKGNLGVYNKDKQWLLEELNNQGIKKLKDIMIATLNDKDELSVIMKNQDKSRRTEFI